MKLEFGKFTGGGGNVGPTKGANGKNIILLEKTQNKVKIGFLSLWTF